MNRIIPVLLLLSVLSLACVLPALEQQQAPTQARSPTTTATAQPENLTELDILRSPSPTPGITCRVSTGNKAGTVNIRSGPGMSYSVISYSSEGDILTLTHPQGLTGWIEIITPAGLQGYFYAPTWCEGK
jgi:uncharacterized protein YgiM (DUF1202 family)